MTNLTYFSRLIQNSWSISWLPFGIDQFLGFPRGWNLSFGLWVKYRSDKAVIPDVSSPSFDMQHALYEPLPEDRSTIRLFLLAPGKGCDPLQGTFSCHPLEDLPSYEALSYAWGDVRSAETIRIGEYESTLISWNLLAALRRLRLPGEYRLLWIDALCINQYNMDERMHQVQLMDEIYRLADNVLIWLGEETEHSHFGMEALAILSDNTVSVRDMSWLKGPPELWQRGIHDVITRSWFSRVWVVQEAALSRRATIICGTHEIGWTNDLPSIRAFARSIKLASMSPAWFEAGLKDVNMDGFLGLLDLQLKQAKTSKELPPPDILDVAYAMRHRNASDPRDKIYAFLGLAEARDIRGRFFPDYTKSLHEVYEDFTKTLEGKILESISDDLKE